MFGISKGVKALGWLLEKDPNGWEYPNPDTIRHKATDIRLVWSGETIFIGRGRIRLYHNGRNQMLTRREARYLRRHHRSQQITYLLIPAVFKWAIANGHMKDSEEFPK